METTEGEKRDATKSVADFTFAKVQNIDDVTCCSSEVLFAGFWVFDRCVFLWLLAGGRISKSANVLCHLSVCSTFLNEKCFLSPRVFH